MTDDQAERLIALAERIAFALEAVVPPPRGNPRSPAIMERVAQLVDQKMDAAIDAKLVDAGVIVVEKPPEA